MLKKKIILGMIVLGSCIGITQARENISNCYNNGLQMACAIVEAGEEFVIKNDTNTISNIMNFDNTTYSNAIAVTLNGSPAYQSIIYWGNDGNPYTVFNRTTAYNPNGAYKINYLCGGEYENLTGNNSIMQYCGVSNNNTDNYGANHYDKTLEEIIQETQGKTPTNYIYHYYNGNDYNLVVCANYEDINYAWCIPGMRQTYSQWSNIYTLMTNGNSANIGITYMEENIGLSPIIEGGGEDEPIITGYDPETGLPCATIDTLIKYETNFKTGMCYSSTYIYSGGQMETITPKTFTELRTGYNQFNNDLNKYRNYCTPPATNEACQNAFGNEEEKRSIIKKIPEERLTDGGKTLYDYCHMYLTYSGDTNICEIDDEELWSASYEDLINAMNEITITQPGTGSVFDNYKDQTARNIITALPSVYYKITSIFRNNTGVKGIIPSYITWIIILIVLFKLFKK